MLILVYFTTAGVYVTLKDINDNRPMFVNKTYHFTVKDTVPVGTILGLVSATDIDSGVNGKVFYYLENGFNFPFEVIDNKIVLKSQLDYTSVMSYQFLINARDDAPGGSRLNSLQAANITIGIQKTNGTAPYFKKELYNVYVLDNITSDVVIVVVQALDKDSGSYGDVTYSLLPSEDSSIFTVTPKTGELTLKPNLQLAYGTKKRHFLSVKATDGMGLSDVAYVIVNVDGRVHPVFSPNKYTATILESTLTGSTVLTLCASNAVSYTIISGNELEIFSLFNQELILKASLSGINKNTYTLVVMATSSTGKTSTLNADVIINIVSCGNSTVKFVKSEYTFDFDENKVAGNVGTVGASIIGKSTMNISYQITYNNEATVNDFVIDSVNGNIRSVRSFDREIKSEYNFQVVADLNGMLDKALVTVLVLDVNEKPKFIKSYPTDVSISEFSNMGSIVAIRQAEDNDLGLNRIISYSLLTSFGGLFLISSNGVVTLNKTLNYDQKSLYSLNVVATDSGIPVQLSTSLSLTINVIKENKPVFNPSAYSVSIEEGPTIRTVTTVTATDADNDAITFSIIGEEATFSIDDKGKIMTKGILDYESKTQFTFHVMASDGRLSSTAAVTVNVSDINDNNPIFSPLTYQATVLITAPVNTSIARVFAVDRDSGANSQISYQIQSGGDSFTIDSDGNVYVGKQLVTSTYVLNISATDKGQPTRSSHTNAILTITTASTPVLSNGTVKFEQLLYEVSKAENFDIQNAVVQVVATLEGAPGQVIYEIKDPKSLFKVSPTGLVIAKKNFDYETDVEHVVCITGRSSLNLGISSTTTVRVDVTDVNDDPPVFSQMFYTANIREDAVIDSSVAAVFTTDRDSVKQLTYSIHSVNSHVNNFTFTIDQDGVIVLKKLLDYHKVSSYNLMIKAADGVHNSLANVTVAVINVNRYRPVFSQSLYNVSIEETNANVIVAQLEVIDADQDKKLTYSIIGEQTIFSVDDFGTVKNILPLNYETAKTHRFCVQVSDMNGADKNIAVTSVFVKVRNAIDAPPVFTSIYSLVSVPFTWPINFEIIQVKASSPELLQITYTIKNHKTVFAIDLNSGVITLNAKLSGVGVYTLQVQAESIHNGISLKTETSIKFNFTGIPTTTSDNTSSVQETTSTTLAVIIDPKKQFGDQWKDIKYLTIYIQQYDANAEGCKNSLFVSFVICNISYICNL